MNSPDDIANKAILDQYGASIIWRSRMLAGLVSVNCPQMNAAALAITLSLNPNVKYAETVTGNTDPWATSCPGQRGMVGALPILTPANVHTFQWARKNSGETIASVVGSPGADMNPIPAWQVTNGNPEIVVAVVDSAISIDHPSLAQSLWTNPYEIPGDGIDNDSNGIIDDIYGANFGNISTGDPRPLSGETDEAWSHGTACAGLIFSDPTSGVCGLAPKCRLMALSVFVGDSIFEQDLIPERFVRALDYALDMKARISSMSVAFLEMPTAFKELLEVAESLDHVVVASAGNTNCNCDISTSGIGRYPAAFSTDYPAVIGVSATDHNDCLAVYDNTHSNCALNQGSSFGHETILIGAPGWWNVSLRMLPNPSQGLYKWFDGTSAAAPHVAGAVALLLSIHPEYTCADVKAKLASSGRVVPSLSGITISGKTLDVGKLIDP